MAIIAEKGVALVTASDGFDVALNDIPACGGTASDRCGRSRGPRPSRTLHPADVSSEQQVETMVLDVVHVANAGISMMKSVLDTTVEDFDRILSVNLRGTFFVAAGRILGGPSSQAHVPGTGKQGQASLSAYSASKFGIRALTQCAGAYFRSSVPVPLRRIGFAQPWNLENTALLLTLMLRDL
ncbi:hypothetical protein EDB89DRAFT_2015217 [Lactarius sanguifluus]|nr:hypothetical protein EDB89DRAFT_2015217 [Lactarius sanguifluus]